MDNVVYLKDTYKPKPEEARTYEEIRDAQFEIAPYVTVWSEEKTPAEIQSLEEFKKQFLIVCLLGLNIGFLIGFLMI